MAKPIISAERLRELFSYDPITGVFTRRHVPPRSNAKAGEVAGCFGDNGYCRIYIEGRLYLAHRLAWLYVQGVWPVDQIDHINGNTSDNRLINLREATNTENQHNQRKANSSNRSGVLGVSWHAGIQKWRAQIKVFGKKHHLGCFATPELAHTAYVTAKRELHPTSTL